ncbi:MAG: pyridoxal-dependent decarboxylase [Nocardioidaceae bacterium]
MEDRLAALDRAHAHATRFLESVNSRPVWPRSGIDEMTRALGGPLPRHGTPPTEVVDELVAAADPGLVGIAGGRFFGFVIGGALPAALAADWLTAVWDQNAGLTSMSPAAAAAESVAGGWLLSILGLPATSSVGFVTGGMMANFSCLAAARHAVLTRVGWDVAERGMSGSPRIRLVVGENRHDTIDRSARYLGLGRENVVPVSADGEGRMRVDALAATLADGEGPVVVCLQAGEVHTGGFDPFGPLVEVARRHDAWVHVDGAFGLWAGAAASTHDLVAGVGEADSWATDAHKTLNVPYDSGIAIVRDPAWSRAAFGVEADYLIAVQDDPFERTPEFSRRARGFPVWAALRSLGSDGVGELVERLCSHARRMGDGLRAVDGVEVVNDVVFTQVVFRCGDDETTRELGRRILAEGTCAMTPAVWRGHAVQRCSISSWRTSEADVDASLGAIRAILAGMHGPRRISH